YRNAIRDILGLDVDVAALLPPDDISHGFDNMAETLNVSPTLMEAYISAARKISTLAIGDPTVKPSVETYHVSANLSQLTHAEGQPLGPRGGMSFVHTFPADGEYVLKMTLYFTPNTFIFGSTSKGEQIEVDVDGEKAALLDVNPMMKNDDELRTPP